MAQLKREHLLHYIDSAMNTNATSMTSPAWELLGVDIEDMSMELNPDVSRVKNILGQTKTKDKGYEPTMEVTPFMADSDSALYPVIRDIAMDRKTGSDCKTVLLEVIVDPSDTTTHTAWAQEVMVKVSSYGGDTEGVNYPFTVSVDGKRVKGTVTKASVTAGAPVFSAAS